jgi:glycosyltransferase involved in cell wall biosynthesis
MPRALILYHFFYPDDVVSSRHFSDLAAGLAERGWDVQANPSNRACRDERRKYGRVEHARGVMIRRVWRAPFRQGTALGRALNSIWMTAAWSIAAARRNPPDVVIIGTDPALSILAAIPWKLLQPKTKIAHWCFDLYPEVAIADGTISGSELFLRPLTALLRSAYRSCDLLVDISPCMRSLLDRYGPMCRKLTITPWALTEEQTEVQTHSQERRDLFGDARLGIIYSGNFGRAHSYKEILLLARGLRPKAIRFAFSIRGNRAEELRNAVSDDDRNIVFVPFADEARLDARLRAADVHIVTLREQWTGAVVPSKFFGALAAGRPVLFAGSPRSSIAHWIEQYHVGWVLNRDNHGEIVKELCRLAEQPQVLLDLFKHCRNVYQEHFSRSNMIDRFDNELRAICDVDAFAAKRKASTTRVSVIGTGNAPHTGPENSL